METDLQASRLRKFAAALCGTSGMQITELSDDDRKWVKERTELLFGGDFVVSRDEVHDPHRLPGFIATEGPERIGLLTYNIAGRDCEIVSIDSLCQFLGIGTLLLERVEEVARAAGCTRLWVITTNDNLAALGFYQRRGFILVALHRNALTASRRLKPEIPLVGASGIPLRDELELELPLRAMT